MPKSRIRRPHKPVPEDAMVRAKFDGDHTICQKLREIYQLSDNEQVKLNSRIAMSMAKSLIKTIKKYKRITDAL